MTAVELLPPSEAGPANERWHELRRAGITASEIAVVMGLSPYDSPFNLYWSKVNDWRWGGNEYTSVGSHLEDAIAEWWATDHADLWARPAGLYAHPDRPWQLATPDRLLRYPIRPSVFRLKALLECKWVAQSWDGWGEEGTDDIPVYYRCQGLWQADTLGVDEVHFAVLGPTGFRAYLVRRDEQGEADLVLMRAAALDMVRRIREGDPPHLDSHSATTGALKKLHPSLGIGDVEVDVELAVKYRVARTAKKVAEERIGECENEIRAALGSDFNRAVCNGKLVASRSIYDQSGDSAELTALEDDWPVVDRLNPGRAESYADA
jgi:putative phage-type endonuclease